MKTISNLAIAAAAAVALAGGTAALAQDARKEEPKAGTEARHAHGEHRGHGMGGMGMGERCHAGSAKSGDHQQHRQ